MFGLLLTPVHISDPELVRVKLHHIWTGLLIASTDNAYYALLADDIIKYRLCHLLFK